MCNLCDSSSAAWLLRPSSGKTHPLLETAPSGLPSLPSGSTAEPKPPPAVLLAGPLPFSSPRNQAERSPLTHRWMCVNGSGVSARRLAWRSPSANVSRPRTRSLRAQMGRERGCLNARVLPPPDSWEVPRFDGWYNSLASPRRGAAGPLRSSHNCRGGVKRSPLSADPVCARAGSGLVRLTPARYWDGVYLPVREPPMPNPRRLSSLLAGGPSGLPSARNQTVLSLFFGNYHYPTPPPHLWDGFRISDL